MRALSVVSSIVSSLRRFSVFLRVWQPYPNYRMNPDLRSPIFPQALCALSVPLQDIGLTHRRGGNWFQRPLCDAQLIPPITDEQRAAQAPTPKKRAVRKAAASGGDDGQGNLF